MLWVFWGDGKTTYVSELIKFKIQNLQCPVLGWTPSRLTKEPAWVSGRLKSDQCIPQMPGAMREPTLNMRRTHGRLPQGAGILSHLPMSLIRRGTALTVGLPEGRQGQIRQPWWGRGQQRWWNTHPEAGGTTRKRHKEWNFAVCR
jgi:hypothetical protein